MKGWEAAHLNGGFRPVEGLRTEAFVGG